MTIMVIGIAALMSACGGADGGAIEAVLGDSPTKKDPPVIQISDITIPDSFFPNVIRDGQEYPVTFEREGRRVSYFYRNFDASYSMSLASVLETAVFPSGVEHDYFHDSLLHVWMPMLAVGKMDHSQWKWRFVLPSFGSQFVKGFSGEVEIREIYYVPLTEEEKRIAESNPDCSDRVAGYISGVMSVQGTVPHTYICESNLGKMSTADIQVNGRFLLPILEPRGGCVIE